MPPTTGLAVGGHVFEPPELGGVDAEEAALGAAVFVDAGVAVGAWAVAEDDLAQQDVLFGLGRFLACG